MADRELIAATLTAGMLAPAPKAAENDAIRDAVAIYERMLNELRRRFPTDEEHHGGTNGRRFASASRTRDRVMAHCGPGRNHSGRREALALPQTPRRTCTRAPTVSRCQVAVGAPAPAAGPLFVPGSGPKRRARIRKGGLRLFDALNVGSLLPAMIPNRADRGLGHCEPIGRTHARYFTNRFRRCFCRLHDRGPERINGKRGRVGLIQQPVHAFIEALGGLEEMTIGRHPFEGLGGPYYCSDHSSPSVLGSRRAVSVSHALGLISPLTRNADNQVREYWNLIHPGPAQRLSMKCKHAPALFSVAVYPDSPDEMAFGQLRASISAVTSNS